MRQGRPKPLEVRADDCVGAVQRGVEIAFSCHDVQELLLDFCWAGGSDLIFGCASSSSPSSLSLRSIIIIVVRIGVACLVLELCEEEIVAPSIITNTFNGRFAIVTTELILPLFPDFGIRRLWASPSFAIEDGTERILEFHLPSDTDVMKEKGVDNFRIGECPKIKLESVFSKQVNISTCIFH